MNGRRSRDPVATGRWRARRPARCCRCWRWAPRRRSASAAEKVQVTDPYIELRTGPGRGYPVFFVAGARGVDRDPAAPHRLVQGAHRQRQRRLGPPRAARDHADRGRHRPRPSATSLLDDYLRRKLELGAAWGQFKGEPMLKIWSALPVRGRAERRGARSARCRASSRAPSSGTSTSTSSRGRIAGCRRSSASALGSSRTSRTRAWSAPYITNANLANAAIGLRYHIAERFVARLDYSIYTAFVSDSDSAEYQAVTAGIAFFF